MSSKSITKAKKSKRTKKMKTFTDPRQSITYLHKLKFINIYIRIINNNNFISGIFYLRIKNSINCIQNYCNDFNLFNDFTIIICQISMWHITKISLLIIIIKLKNKNNNFL